MNKKLLPILFLFCLLSVGCVSPSTQFSHAQTLGVDKEESDGSLSRQMKSLAQCYSSCNSISHKCINSEKIEKSKSQCEEEEQVCRQMCNKVEKVIKDGKALCLKWETNYYVPCEDLQIGEEKKEKVKAGSGTCFAINSNGQIVTSYHVVEGSDNIKVRLEDGQLEEAKLLKSSPTNDLAVLQIQRKTPNFLPLTSAKTVSLGTSVFTMGFPATSILGSDVKFSEGVINSLSGFQNDASYMQVSMPIHPGNSGGPIVTDDGNVVGVVTASAAIIAFIEQTGTLPQNVNWGVKADYLIPMIDKLETPIKKANNRQEAIELVRKALCLITVE